MIDLLDRWMLESSVNFNVFVGMMMLIYMGSIVALFFIGKKVGKPNEKTNAIYLRVISSMFFTQLIMTGLFISLVDSNIHNFRQFLLLFQAIVLLIGAVSAFGFYQKGYNNRNS
jgi:hypothetical protein